MQIKYKLPKKKYEPKTTPNFVVPKKKNNCYEHGKEKAPENSNDKRGKKIKSYKNPTLQNKLPNKKAKSERKSETKNKAKPVLKSEPKIKTISEPKRKSTPKAKRKSESKSKQKPQRKPRGKNRDTSPVYTRGQYEYDSDYKPGSW